MTPDATRARTRGARTRQRICIAVRPAIVLALVWLTIGATVSAQEDPDSRAAELRRAREQKAASLQPYDPGKIERVLLWLENNRSWERLLNPAEGTYPKVGTITPGSGISFGAGYRYPELFSERGAFSTMGMVSFQAYWLVNAQLNFPELANGRLYADLAVEAYDHQSESFISRGPEARLDQDYYYGFRNTSGSGLIGFRLAPWVSIGAGAEYLVPVVDPPRRGGALQARFTAAELPGLDRQPNFGRYIVFAEVNTREPRGNPRTGGLYAVRYERFDDRDFNVFNFDRVEAEIQQYLSIFNQRRVLALHGVVSSSVADAGQFVPFYLQRTLGGPDTLRGFRRNSLRDDNVLLLQAEYRWEVFTAMDAALFGDWGKVAARPEDLDLQNLEHDYGIGVRFGTDNGVFLRIEGAFGSRHGAQYVFRFGNVF